MTDPRTVVQRVFEEVINQRRDDVIDELFAEDFLDHGPLGELRGREPFRASVKAYLDAFPDLRCEVTNLIAEGDVVAWVVRSTGTHMGDGLGFPATGKRIDTLSANLGRFRHGKAVEHWSEQGMIGMLQQVGLLPAMAPPAGVS